MLRRNSSFMKTHLSENEEESQYYNAHYLTKGNRTAENFLEEITYDVDTSSIIFILI